MDPSGFYRSPKPPRADYASGDTPQAISEAKAGNYVPRLDNDAFIMLNGSNPNDVAAIKVLQDNGLDGIWYRNKRPDFIQVSSFNVTIDNMSTNRTGKGGNYDQTRTAIAVEIMNSKGNINTLIQNGVISDYATATTKKQVQKFLKSDQVQKAIANNDYDKLDNAIIDYMSSNKLVVHEVDGKGTELIPSELNQRFNHDGGVADVRKSQQIEEKTNKCSLG